MRRFVLMLAAIAVIAAAPALAAEMTVTGELVDHACYTNRGAENGFRGGSYGVRQGVRAEGSVGGACHRER